MATFTDVDTEQIRRATQDIRQNITILKRVRNELDSSVLSRLVSCWQGEAKDLFTQQFIAYCASLKILVEEYETLGIDLELAEGAYRQANEQITRQINQLR